MFPLGLALVPGAVLPLHIFEPRYRALVSDCLAGEADFGVVLIERGSEVGGGEVRSAVGTVAHIVDGHVYDDGRYALVCVGTTRMRVEQWLPDDPYPRARVAAWPDDLQPVNPGLRERVLGRLAALVAARNGDEAALADIAGDPTTASYQVAVLAGLGPFDLQQSLQCPDAEARFQLLETLIEDHIALLGFGDHR